MPRKVEDPRQVLANNLLEKFQAVWKEQYDIHGTDDPIGFSRMSVIALSSLAAVVAVDVGIDSNQFVSICVTQHNQAYQRAPKFG